MQIAEKYFDVAGKYRATVINDENSESVYLKFQSFFEDVEIIENARMVFEQNQIARGNDTYLSQLLEEERKLMEELGDGGN